MLNQLKPFPAEAIKLSLKLIDAGFANWPTALQATETFDRHHIG
jgi:hypothetical protein